MGAFERLASMFLIHSLPHTLALLVALPIGKACKLNFADHGGIGKRGALCRAFALQQLQPPQLLGRTDDLNKKCTDPVIDKKTDL